MKLTCRAYNARSEALYLVDHALQSIAPALQDAEVFRKAQESQEPQGKAGITGAKRTRGVAFGTGAADEDDSYGMMEDYAVDDSDKRKGMLFEIADGSDEEDMPLVMGR